MRWNCNVIQLGSIAALGIALILVGAVVQVRRSETPDDRVDVGSQPPEKLYTNKTFGFSFLYPPGASVAVLGPGAVQLEINDTIPPFAVVVETEQLDIGIHSLQDVLFEPDAVDHSDTFYRYLVRQADQSAGTFLASTTVGTDRALAIGITCADGRRPFYLYYVVHAEVLYQVSAADLCTYPNGAAIFQSLLSSFAFGSKFTTSN